MFIGSFFYAILFVALFTPPKPDESGVAYHLQSDSCTRVKSTDTSAD